MRVPTIHLNGTSQERLLEVHENAGRALGAAIDALSDAAPNGRDFYPQGEQALSEAMREHRARMEKLNEVRSELVQLMEAIAESS